MVWCPDRGALAVLTALVALRMLAAVPGVAVPVVPPVMITASATNSAVLLDDAAWRDLASVWDAGHDKPVGSPVENLTLPLDHHLNGRVRAVLHARTASLADDHYVRAWQVTVDLFTAEGGPDGRIVAESGLFDRGSRRGYCRGAVSFTRQDARVSGIDMYWSADQQRLRILSHGEVRTKGLTGRIGGLR
jgi:hypothetical protein